MWTTETAIKYDAKSLKTMDFGSDSALKRCDVNEVEWQHCLLAPTKLDGTPMILLLDL